MQIQAAGSGSVVLLGYFEKSQMRHILLPSSGMLEYLVFGRSLK